MSADSQIFVQAATAESVMSSVTTLLPDSLLRSESLGRGISFVTDRLLGDVHTHEYENDGRLKFSDYPLVVEFHGLRNRPDYMSTQQDFGQRLFDTLRQRGLGLLWVDNLQILVAEHHPPSTAIR